MFLSRKTIKQSNVFVWSSILWRGIVQLNDVEGFNPIAN